MVKTRQNLEQTLGRTNDETNKYFVLLVLLILKP